MDFHHRKLNRLQGFDYSSVGDYFVTICTQNKEHWFGEVQNQQVILSDIGKIAYDKWLNIPTYYTNVKIQEFIIMPNHIHGIISIVEKYNIVKKNNLSFKEQHFITQKIMNIKPMGLLSQIIKSYKEQCVKIVKRDFQEYAFEWQRSFYDHIIRDAKSLKNIKEYILNNPNNWAIESLH